MDGEDVDEALETLGVAEMTDLGVEEEVLAARIEE